MRIYCNPYIVFLLIPYCQYLGKYEVPYKTAYKVSSFDTLADEVYYNVAMLCVIYSQLVKLLEVCL